MSIKYSDFVKAPNKDVEYDTDKIQKLILCKENPFEFFNYVKIVHPDLGRTIFNLRNYQKSIIELIHNNRFFIGLLSRQSGKTISVAAYILWYACFNSDKFIGIGSNKAASAKDFLSRIRTMYEELPVWIKPGVVEYNKYSIVFENGTRIETSATTPDSFRGRALSILCLDEFAFVPPNIAQDFWAANYPAISASKKSKIIIISTPSGIHNLFWRIYTDAENKRNSFAYFKSTWRDVPGRNEKWKKEQLKNMTQTQFNQEFEVDFVGSVDTVIDIEVLKKLPLLVKNPIERELDGDLLIYQKPEKESSYVIGVDTAKGTGGNASSAQVLKIISEDPPKAEQVAVYNNNKIDVFKFTDVIYRLANYYNSAYVIVESNAEGIAVVNKLWWDLEYDNLLNESKKRGRLGIRSTTKTKINAVLFMKKMIENGNLSLCDDLTIKQLSDFIEDDNKFYGKTLNDDNVSALYWACYLWKMNVLEEGSGSFIDNTEEDAWGILAGYNKYEEDWSWLRS